jgi:hypothetical protein
MNGTSCAGASAGKSAKWNGLQTIRLNVAAQQPFDAFSSQLLLD